jgi:hypothetical protein
MLPAKNQYGWRFLIKHMREAGQEDKADRLLSSYAWIKAKLQASGAQGLFDSYLPEARDEAVRLVGRAVALSLPALAANPHELPRQLYGRLGGLVHESVAGIVASAQQDPDFSPAPRWPSLTPPGDGAPPPCRAPGPGASASFAPEGGCIVTASADRTARLWDATTGQEIITLRGHEDRIWSAAFFPDGTRIITASADRTARLWDATTGQEIIVLRGHEYAVLSAAFSPDGARIVTALR